MLRVLTQVERVPMLGMAHPKYKVDHLASSFLPVGDGCRRIGVWRQRPGCRRARLREYAGAVGKRVGDRRVKCPHHPLKAFGEFNALVIDSDKLVVSELPMRQLLE